jgi:hypothetical protein
LRISTAILFPKFQGNPRACLICTFGELNIASMLVSPTQQSHWHPRISFQLKVL